MSFNHAVKLLTLVVALLNLNAASLSAAPQIDYETAARTYIADLSAGQFEKAAANFDAGMKAAAPPKALDTIWKSLTAQLGPFEKALGSRVQEKSGMVIVDVNCRFRNTTTALQIVFSADRQISGFTVQPAFDEAPDTSGQPLILKTQTGEIHGTLEIPKGQGPFPIVLLIAGSGPTDRNGNQPTLRNDSLKKLSHALRDNKIATLRYDKRGIAASQKAGPAEDTMSFDNFVQDATEWIALLNKDKRFSSVSVLGHSQGSLVAAMASRKSKVKSVISVAGAAMPVQNVLKRQLGPKLPAALKTNAFEIVDQLAAGKRVSPVPSELQTLFRPSVQPFLSSWMKYRPMTEFKALTIPVLVINGTTDIQVETSSARQLAKANPHSKLVMIKDMNHVLRNCKIDADQMKTYADPKLPLHKDLLKPIVEFLTGQE